MSNTIIQIKRSSVTAVPLSLESGELAYSFNSDKIFIGNNTNEAIAIGGKAFVDYQNTLTTTVGSAYDQANTANLLAFNVAIGANAWTNAVFGYSNTRSDAIGVAANTYANATFVKLIAGSQTISGDIAITGNLFVSGNTTTVGTQDLVIEDPVILLANNNTTDLTDIGFVAHYANDTSVQVHTGLVRESVTKQWYLFKDYDDHFLYSGGNIDLSGNNFTLDTLNANFVTNNLFLGGANAILTIGAAFDKANAANVLAFDTGVGANAYASAVGVAANLYADSVGAASNTNAANASYLSTGTVSPDRVSGSYTGITGLGTVTVGTWNANTITVPYGGTGVTSFTENGILYGNTTGDLKVTAAGTDGQVLQSDQGVPKFAMLDGGAF